MGFTMCLSLFFDAFTLAFMSIRILEQFFTVRHGRQVWTGYKEQGGHGFSRLLRFEDAWRMRASSATRMRCDTEAVKQSPQCAVWLGRRVSRCVFFLEIFHAWFLRVLQVFTSAHILRRGSATHFVFNL